MTNGLLFEIDNVNYSIDSLLLKCCTLCHCHERKYFSQLLSTFDKFLMASLSTNQSTINSSASRVDRSHYKFGEKFSKRNQEVWLASLNKIQKKTVKILLKTN